MLSARAAAEKLLFSTTFTKIVMPSTRSMASHRFARMRMIVAGPSRVNQHGSGSDSPGPAIAGRLTVEVSTHQGNTNDEGSRPPCGRQRSGPEILEPGQNQPLYDSKDHRGGNTEHERSVRRLQRSQQSPRRCQKQITVAQCGVVDRRVVVGASELPKFSTHAEQHGPQIDLEDVRHERERYNQPDDCKINQGACTCAPVFPHVAKEVSRRGQSKRMDENRTCDCAYADRQRKQDRELLILHHLFHHKRSLNRL